MYIILGEEQIALTLWYWRGVKKLVMYLIIIADIAPKIPGGLMHLIGPGRCEISHYTGFITRPTIGWLNTCKDVHNGKMENETFSLGLIMLLK